ncbi:hypothetical protein FQN51_002980 [Onygenales sp. PD_10]|nr:hypothetical protein FQN51_002980 [Onygenales sp. PD_10]
MPPSPSPSSLPLPPELLTSILTHLDPLTLLHAQRVSHHWHQTITTSPTLQQTLYLHPLPNPTNAVLNPTLNPLLLPLFPTLFTLTNRPPYAHFLNPHGIASMAWAQDAGKRRAVLRPTASWRRMFPVQPPARVDVIKRRGYCCLYRMVRRDAKVRDEFEDLQGGGARMGLVYDLLMYGLEKWADGRFFVRWHMFPARDGEGWEGERRRLLRDKGYDEVEGKGGGGGGGGGKVLENRITLYCRFSEKCWNREVKEYGLWVVERFGRGKLRRLREEEREDGYYYAETSDSEDEPDDDEGWEEEEEEGGEGEQGDDGEEDDSDDSDLDFENSDDSAVSE